MNLDPGWIFFMLMTSGMGFIYFQYGRKNSRYPFLLAGIGLMMAAYFAHTATSLGVVGLVLTAAPFIYKKFR